MLEFTAIKYRYENDTEVYDGVLIHDSNDQFNDGDMIADGCIPEDEMEAQWRVSEATSYFHVDGNGIYVVD